MRNLSISRVDEINFGTEGDVLPISACAFDRSTGDLILSLGPTPAKPVIELRRQKKAASATTNENATTISTTWDAPCPLPDLECDRIVSLHYITDTHTSCLVLAGGDLILVRDQPGPNDEKIEIVGSIDVGITAAVWSWDGATLAVVTRHGTLVLMTQQLEPVKESTFVEDDLHLSKHVSVGWGKKETQFQGKRAKAMKDPTMPDTVDEGHPSPFENGSTTISWRGDSAYVAVNSALNSKRRVIRIYSADGTLDSVSEPVDGLEHAVSWRPHGNIIASTRRSPEKIQVVFFERNGLRHGEFDLRLRQDEMSSVGRSIALTWNRDSSILAVVMMDRVQFWTMGNYHYYLKRELWLDCPHNLVWHSNDPLECLLSNSDKAQIVSFGLEVEPASMVTPFDYGLVGVVDGSRLKLNPFKHVNIPPPMAYINEEMDDNIITHAISNNCQRIAVMTKEHLHLYDWQMLQTSSKKDTNFRHAVKGNGRKLSLPAELRETSQYAQVAILNDEAVYIFIPVRSWRSSTTAILYRLFWDDDSQLSGMTKIMIPPTARQIIRDNTQRSLWVRTDCSVSPVELQGPSLPSFPIDSSSSPKPSIVNISTSFGDICCCFYLDERNQLICGDAVRAKGVTSLTVTEKHLVYTTSTHFLKFVHLTDPSTMVFPPDASEPDERCRSIEREATIVTVIPSTYGVILQMPRGNLETIFPRILVLGGVRKSIEELDYRSAFLVCQTHQIDLNILHDYDVQLWEANVEKFVDQLKKPSRVDEFIQKLKEEDVTATLYHDTRSSEAIANGFAVAPVPNPKNKVNKACDALIEVLKTKAAAYQQNIITAHVCKRPPDLVAALTMVSDLRKESQEEADLAVAHLCFLSDANRLFDVSLALYDLELTLLVAQNAQRDPREYMPFLQSLQAMPDGRRQYTIDNHLKKFMKALEWLYVLGSHDEAEAYTVKHNLYTAAMRISKHDKVHLQKVMRLYADHLTTQSQYQSAATLYESLSDFEAAYPLYTLAHQWREALMCAGLIPLREEKLQSLAKQLASTCADESRDYRSAATIYLEYLDEPVAAAELLCRGSYFAEAGRLLSHPRRNLAAHIPLVIDIALTKKFGEIIEVIADCQSQLGSQVPRIGELRKKKAEDPLAFFGGDAPIDGPDIPDNVSLAPTDASTLGGQSMFTKYGGGAGGSAVSTKFGGTIASNMSRKTSKTKRREERKRARGKKGSVYEEEYLVASVARLIDRVNGTHDEVRRLYSGLMRRGFAEQAGKVEEIMLEMQKACEDAKKEVWEMSQGEVSGDQQTWYDANGEGRPHGADGVLYDSQLEMQEGQKKPPPEVKVWKGGT